MKRLISKFAVVLAIAFVVQFVNFTPLFTSKSYASGNLKLEMYNVATGSPSNTLSPRFKITNLNSTSINLTDVKIRYYFTADGNQQQTFECDYASNDNTNITATVSGIFVQMPLPVNNADNYVEIGFSSNAGSLASNKSAEIVTRIHTPDWANYTQSNDYSFNSSSNNQYVVWDKAPVYNSGTLECGSDPKKFLIIVAKPLYSGLTQLATYQTDLIGDGYSSTVVTVDNTSSTNPQYVCTTASQLKENVIRNYYNAGYVVFVLIGSYPSIPTAYWRPLVDDRRVLISDYYFADLGGMVDSNFDGVNESVTDWIDLDGDNVYEVCGYRGTQKIPLMTKPEMFYGRIDAGGISTDTSEQITKINGYLLKLHNFRVGRNSIPTTRMKAFGFVHQDWNGEYSNNPTYEYDLLKTVFPHMNIMEDKETNSTQNLTTELQNEYYFSHIITHGSTDTVYPANWVNNHEGNGPAFTLSDLNALGPTSPKSYYIHSFGCSTSQYLDPTLDQNNLVVGASNIPNIGAAYLFNNNTTVNVTGVCASVWSNLDQQYFTGLSTMSIGESYKGWLNRIYDSGGWSDVPCYVLLGDPTLKHPLQQLTNCAPVITNNLGTLEATAGQTFTLPLTISNPEINESVSVTVPVMPTGAAYNSTTKTITWTPSLSQERQGGDFKVVLQDAAGNTCTESFHIYIRDPFNLEFETGPDTSGIPTGWTTYAWQNLGDVFQCVESDTDSNNWEFPSYGGNYMGKIKCTQSNHCMLDRQMTVKANTNYRVRGYIKTLNIINNESGDQGASLCAFCGNSWFRSTQELFGTNDWTEVSFTFNSGNSTSVDIYCALGGFYNICTGTAWFDDIYLEEV